MPLNIESILLLFHFQRLNKLNESGNIWHPAIPLLEITPIMNIPPEYPAVTTSMEVEEDSQSELCETVERILMAVEVRQASRSKPKEVFDIPSSSISMSQPVNLSMRQCHQHQGSLERGMYCHGGDLTEAEVSQLVVLCAPLTTTNDVQETNNKSQNMVTPDNVTSNPSSKKEIQGWTSVDNDNISALIPLLEKHLNSAACIDLIGESRSFLELHSKERNDAIIDQVWDIIT